jgi:hypothetical protein
MTRTELIIQLLKLAIGLAFGAYFVWWSLQVLDRLTPEADGTAMVGRIFKPTSSSCASTQTGPAAMTLVVRSAPQRPDCVAGHIG